jgi:hypothetical protein
MPIKTVPRDSVSSHSYIRYCRILRKYMRAGTDIAKPFSTQYQVHNKRYDVMNMQTHRNDVTPASRLTIDIAVGHKHVVLRCGRHQGPLCVHFQEKCELSCQTVQCHG